MRRPIALALALAGCNQIWGLDPTTTVGSGPCDPLPFDLKRYRTYGGSLTWKEARDSCARYDMDLVVIDQLDNLEIANELTASRTPFWLGVSFGVNDWVALDGCPPVLSWAAGEPTDPTPGSCVIQTADRMASASCATRMAGAAGINALCETARPDAHCRQLATERDYQLLAPTITAPIDLAAAAVQCSNNGMHVLEINSSDELDYVLAHVATNVPKFWVAAQWNGTHFTSPTGCPQVYDWQSSEPSLVTTCVVYQAGMVNVDCGSSFNPVICERNSM